MESKPKNLLKGTAGLEIKPGGTYLIFFDPMSIDVRDLERLEFPFEVNITFIPTMTPADGRSVEVWAQEVVEEAKHGSSS